MFEIGLEVPDGLFCVKNSRMVEALEYPDHISLIDLVIVGKPFAFRTNQVKRLQ